MKEPRLPPWFDSLRSILIPDPSICLAYLFGSQATGRSTYESDVDVGVFLYSPYADNDVDRVWSLVEEVVPAPVDLVVINDAPPLISAAAMQGRRIVVKDTYVEIETWLRISGEAMDFAEFFDALWVERERLRKG